MVMRNFRRCYYNKFSRFYDQFVSLHSSDKQGAMRFFLASLLPVQEGQVVLDLCSGTGSLLLYLRKRVGLSGLVVGVDFSIGMLRASQRKVNSYNNIGLLESNVGYLPFHAEVFDAVTCSHAFYELQGELQDLVLREVVRVLKPGKPFLLMEHDIPRNALVRVLFYIRLLSMGSQRAVAFLRDERERLKRYFKTVEKISTPTGRSKIMSCRN